MLSSPGHSDLGQDLGKECRGGGAQKQRRLSWHNMRLSPWLGAQAFSMKNKGRRALAPLPDGTRPHALKAKFESTAPGLYTPPAAPRKWYTQAHALVKQRRKVSPLAACEKPKALRTEGICPLTKPIKSRPRIKLKPPKRLPHAWEAFSHMCSFALIPLMLKSRPVEEQSCSGSNPIQGSFSGKVWENFLYNLTQNTSDARDLPCGPVVRTWCFHCSGSGSILGWGTKILPTTPAKKKKNTSDVRRMDFFPQQCNSFLWLPYNLILTLST